VIAGEAAGLDVGLDLQTLLALIRIRVTVLHTFLLWYFLRFNLNCSSGIIVAPIVIHEARGGITT
jgi:hypothetical protein